MARSDLLIALVKAGSSGDKTGVRAATEAIIAEERSKNHNVLAERLVRAVTINGSQNGGFHSIEKRQQHSERGQEFLFERMPRISIEDLVLSKICSMGVSQFVEEQRRASLLRSHGLDPRNRILLIGPPGNGKSSLAEAIAEALSVPFFVVRYDALIGSYLGETASRLRRIFEYARTTPCVLFFDEFDAVGKERGDRHETGEIKRVVTSLLMQVDDLPSYTVVIAATNHAELLDRAVWRRFQLRLTLPAPTSKELAAFIEAKIKRIGKPVLDIRGTTLAKKLGAISFAEAEQFVFDVQRQHVLSMNDMSLKEIIEKQLELWRERAKTLEVSVTGGIDGGTTDSSTATSN